MFGSANKGSQSPCLSYVFCSLFNHPFFSQVFFVQKYLLILLIFSLTAYIFAYRGRRGWSYTLSSGKEIVHKTLNTLSNLEGREHINQT